MVCSESLTGEAVTTAASRKERRALESCMVNVAEGR
jgi:hypothetical protein